MGRSRNDGQSSEASAITKFQRGETMVVNRSQLNAARYNPRMISEESLKRLKKAIKQHGLIGATIVWNKRTGTVVSGHQRLNALDLLEKNQDYELEVSVIDVDLREEKQLNVQLNNLSMQGDWDIDKLADMIETEDFSNDDLGFTDADIDYLFGGDDRFSELYQDTPEVKDTKAMIAEIKKDRKEAADRFKKEQSPDYYLQVICESQEDKDKLLKEIGVPVSEMFVSSGQIRRLKRFASQETDAGE